jgi:hypothetical protein
MTRDQKAIADYLSELKDLMGLRDWWVEVDWSSPPAPEEEGYESFTTEATMSCTPRQRHGVLRLSPDFIDEYRDKDYVSMILVHELVHCHFAALREVMRTGSLLKHVGQAQYDALGHHFDEQWEYAIDAIARAWVKRLPKLKWPSSTRSGKTSTRGPRQTDH